MNEWIFFLFLFIAIAGPILIVWKWLRLGLWLGVVFHILLFLSWISLVEQSPFGRLGFVGAFLFPVFVVVSVVYNFILYSVVDATTPEELPATLLRGGFPIVQTPAQQISPKSPIVDTEIAVLPGEAVPTASPSSSNTQGQSGA